MENWNNLFCRKISILTAPHCQFWGVGQDMKHIDDTCNRHYLEASIFFHCFKFRVGRSVFEIGGSFELLCFSFFCRFISFLTVSSSSTLCLGKSSMGYFSCMTLLSWILLSYWQAFVFTAIKNMHPPKRAPYIMALNTANAQWAGVILTGPNPLESKYKYKLQHHLFIKVYIIHVTQNKTKWISDSVI